MIDKKEYSVKLGQRIRQVREEKGITMRDFEMFENSIDRATLSKIKNGKIMPTVFTLAKICNVLDQSLKEFFSEY